ncbi:AlpA family phage regulatory protein [Erwinia endophytica]|uniref:helix-turn-helix transcriptional regulator n=1 Tax=Erwinia endophytica TaxID=1563158 RepID=UPI001266001F|nr:AlpA family phage regulatory protein [Erwinia endophytica]KAB8310550.1 AlpA family phage regulatory protein [Erwinia endophytica]
MNSQEFTFPTNGNARPKSVARYLAVHISTLWRYAKLNPDFPKPRKLTDGVTVFDAADVRQWNEKRKEGAEHA